MRRATQGFVDALELFAISIHALHEESDYRPWAIVRLISISIHALHEESDLVVSSISSQQKKFQSTLSMRRATRAVQAVCSNQGISIHALHEESDGFQQWRVRGIPISIHALHEESDALADVAARIINISIHALHEESDLVPPPFEIVGGGISIHALHEESDSKHPTCTHADRRFQSTLSMRRATVQLDIFVRFLRRKPAA